MSGARLFNRGGSIDRDYMRVALQVPVVAHNVSIAALFARDLDDGSTVQYIAQFGNPGSDSSRAFIGIPSSTDAFRAGGVSSTAFATQATTTGALTARRFYVGVGRFVSASLRTAERTGAALASNTTVSDASADFTELLIARKAVSTFQSFPGWLRWVTFWRTAISQSESAALAQDWVNPLTIRPDAIVAHVDFRDGRRVIYSPSTALVWALTGEAPWSTFGPYPIRTRRRRIFIPSPFPGVEGFLDATEAGDSAAIAGGVAVQGDMAATETGQDIAAFNGTSDRLGDMAVQEAGDIAAIAGELEAFTQGAMAAIDAGDIASIEGAVAVIGTLAAIEAQDQAAIRGVAVVEGAMFPPLFQVCAASAAVRALLGAAPVRLWPFGEGDPMPQYPYAVWQLITGTPSNYLGQVPDMDSFGIQLDVYAQSAASAREVAHALRAAVEQAAYVTAYIGEFRDTITRSYRYSFSVDWFVPR